MCKTKDAGLLSESHIQSFGAMYAARFAGMATRNSLAPGPGNRCNEIKFLTLDGCYGDAVFNSC
jgi:hypothetical protein